MVKKDREIEVQPLIITTPALYEVTIRGLDSLLMNKMPDLSIPKPKGSKQQQVDRLAEEERTWQEKAYYDGAGNVLLPGENLHESLKQGAAYWGQKIPGAGNKTYTDLVSSAVVVEDMPLGITRDDLIPYGRAVNGTPTKRTPSKVYKIRPLVRPWGGSFKLHVFDSRLDASILRTIISYAGIFRGVGDWRPKFGRYELAKIEQVM